jgi:hypothetical protein
LDVDVVNNLKELTSIKCCKRRIKLVASIMRPPKRYTICCKLGEIFSVLFFAHWKPLSPP